MALTSPTQLEASVRNHVLGTVACRTGQPVLVANGNAPGPTVVERDGALAANVGVVEVVGPGRAARVVPGRGVAAIVHLEVNWVLDAGVLSSFVTTVLGSHSYQPSQANEFLPGLQLLLA